MLSLRNRSRSCLFTSSLWRSSCNTRRQRQQLTTAQPIGQPKATQKKKLSPTSSEVRQNFIDFFVKQNGHQFVRSSPVKPPSSDQSLLFVNAGMNQFKPIFLDQLGSDGDHREPHLDHLRELRRVANSQKCIRVGGKHCDLETVGTDFTHHTFFEMLGNWSFNDYFKKEACQMAWTLLTSVYRIDPSRLFVTIFGGNEQLGLQTDLETYDIWRSIGVPSDRIIPLGINDNFWEMGETGPCGICTEIHYQFPEFSGTSSGDFQNFQKNLLDNSVEIWNIVFMQYFRDSSGKLNRLEKNFIDTGMGLERILSLVQNVPNNYSTDLFVPYFDRLSQLCHWPLYSNRLNDPIDIAYRILADHSRMATISIADGVIPDDRGSGYLLRRVLRRAIESIRTITSVHPLPNDLKEWQILSALANTAIESLGGAFPELERNSEKIDQTIEDEVRLYSSAIVRNGQIMKLASNLSISLCEEPVHNEAVILDKLNLIHNNMTEIREKFGKSKQETLPEQASLDLYRRKLHQLNQLINTDLATRFGLVSENIISQYKQNEHLLIELENKLNQVLQEIITTFKYCTSRVDRNYHSDQFNVVSIDFEEFSDYHQQDQHLDQLLLKISLDLFGDRPLVTMIYDSSSGIFLVQLSVPGSRHEMLQADIWFDQAKNLVVGTSKMDLITIETIQTRRIHKLAKYRCTFRMDQVSNQTQTQLVESFRRACVEVASKHFIGQ